MVYNCGVVGLSFVFVIWYKVLFKKLGRGTNVASKSSDVCFKIILVCVDCKECNYIIKKNCCNDLDCMELKKFCFCCCKYIEYCEIC